MQAVLYICHGSRVKEAGEQARFFVKRCMRKIDAPIQEICFLELEQPSISDGFKRCVEKGATRIAVIPILLLTAAHAKKDIPEQLQVLGQKYPSICISYGRPLGVHEQLPSILLDLIGRTRIGTDAMVLLVGRGSSDPEVKHDMGQIATLLKRMYPFQKVEVCFLAAAEPNFEEGLQRALRQQHKQVFVVPYLLFTGRLMKKIERIMERMNRTEFVLCSYLGRHPGLVEVLKERTEETIKDDRYVSDYVAYEW